MIIPPYPLWPIAMALGLLMVTGCASDDEFADPGYGNSVRHMIATQTATPGSSAYGLDGIKAGLTLDKYRKDVANPKDVDTQDLTGSRDASGSGSGSGKQ
jgi:hypothetical protein